MKKDLEFYEVKISWMDVIYEGCQAYMGKRAPDGTKTYNGTIILNDKIVAVWNGKQNGTRKEKFRYMWNIMGKMMEELWNEKNEAHPD